MLDPNREYLTPEEIKEIQAGICRRHEIGLLVEAASKDTDRTAAAVVHLLSYRNWPNVDPRQRLDVYHKRPNQILPRDELEKVTESLAIIQNAGNVSATLRKNYLHGTNHNLPRSLPALLNELYWYCPFITSSDVCYIEGIYGNQQAMARLITPRRFGKCHQCQQEVLIASRMDWRRRATSRLCEGCQPFKPVKQNPVVYNYTYPGAE